MPLIPEEISPRFCDFSGEPYIPSREEKERVKVLINELISTLKKLFAGYDAQIAPVGSTAKDTFLAGDHDIDIYILSDRYRDLYELASAAFPEGHQKHGELLIWNFRYKGCDVDLVFVPPDYEKRDTIYHTQFYLEHLTEKDRNEVRKAKAFFKSHGVYGAEVGGIVGVAIEELVRKYHTLENICRLFLENELEDLWLQDPVLDRPRNLLASITKSKYRKIREACRKYLETGTFEYKKYTLEDFIGEHGDYKFVKCDRKFDRATDYNTSVSVCRSVGRLLKNLDSDIEFECESYVNDEVVIAFKTQDELPPKKEICIPKHLEHAIEGFVKKHPGVELYEKDGYICGLVDRKVRFSSEKMEEMIIDKMEKRGYSCSIF